VQLPLHHFDSGTTGTAGVAGQVFNAAVREAVVHQVVVAFAAGARSGSKAQKTRAEARGGGRKPWRQKGLGRARAGTLRSPLWRGGGVTFAARPRSHAHKVNRKMYRGAMRSIFSELVRNDRLMVFDRFQVSAPKTREAVACLRQWQLQQVLIITEALDRDLALAVRNLPQVEVAVAARLDPRALIAFDKVLMTEPALRKVEAWLS